MIRIFIAFVATVITITQTALIYLKGAGICFNDGCEIVESLTVVSPLIFNVAGVFFFQLIFWTLVWGRNGSVYWYKFADLILLCGLCAEAVLLFFQYRIAEVFCSYCLIIFCCILLLNILSGPKQLFRGIVLFCTIMVACFSLQWKAPSSQGGSYSLDSGTMAVTQGRDGYGVGYLFFSSSCVHCEEIIGMLREDNLCSVRFNPVEQIDDFQFPGAKNRQGYSHQTNIDFLKMLSITEIPVFVVDGSQEKRILRGAEQIKKYIEGFCQNEEAADYSGSTSIVPGQSYISGVASAVSDGCVLAEDCDDTAIEGKTTTQ